MVFPYNINLIKEYNKICDAMSVFDTRNSAYGEPWSGP